MAAANPWLTAMGLPQWQLRGEVAAIAKVATTEVADRAPAAVVAEPEMAVTLVKVEPLPLAAEKVVLHQPEQNSVSEPVVQSADVVKPSEQEVVAAALAAQMKQVPLLVIWDEQEEQAAAGAGSLPSGELGDLLANIVLAVGLTEDVVEAWSMPPADISAALLVKNLAPRSVWHFSVAQPAKHQSLQVNGVQYSIELISAPSLRELQAQKPLKAQLWRLLKPLADAGLWR